MVCKFNHDGNCCNCGSPHYKDRCRPLLCDCGDAMTNADRIRAMSDEELAELFRDIYNAGGEYAENWYRNGSRTSCFTWDEEWLQQPAEVPEYA